MLVVVKSPFFGNGVSAKIGDVLDVADGTAKDWVKNGLVAKYSGDKPATATVAEVEIAEAPKADAEVKTDKKKGSK